MKRKSFLFLIILNACALMGIMIIQGLWIKRNFMLRSELFNSSIMIALKGVANQMQAYQLAEMNKTYDHEQPLQPHKHLPEVDSIDAGLLDFKMSEELNCMHLGDRYEYGIVRNSDKKILMGNARDAESILRSGHHIELAGFADGRNHILAVRFFREPSLIITRMFSMIFLSSAFALILILSFYFMVRFFLRQKKLAEIKSDFISNMTHEFKTPLATISLASEMLLKKEVSDDLCKAKRYAKIIHEENARMQYQVDHILNVSLMDRGEYVLRKKDLNVHNLLIRLAQKFDLTVKDRQGTIYTDFKASNPTVHADETHLNNIFNNLLDNANKYSPSAPEIMVRTYDAANGILISIEDEGIGISPENHDLVFKNLFRVPTGNVHNIKGFGIGLYYVKTMVEAHGGTIKLWSDLGQGSRFDVYLPYNDPNPNTHAE
jgi:two-component system phosphate regulon sensor histidine kinase PhoR